MSTAKQSAPASEKELANMSKASAMPNEEIVQHLRFIARLQNDDALAKWVLGVAAERLAMECPDKKRMDYLEKYGATYMCSRDVIDAYLAKEPKP